MWVVSMSVVYCAMYHTFTKTFSETRSQFSVLLEMYNILFSIRNVVREALWR